MNNIKQPTVSVLIPAYNREGVIADAIDSVLAQTVAATEVLVLDDGSTDSTGEVVRSYADPRVRYSRQENRGIAATRNALAKMASGDLLAFLDSDDIWVPEKLEMQLPLFDRPEVGLVYSERKWMNERREEVPANHVRRYRGPKLYRKLLLENFIPTSSVVVRRDAFFEAGGFDERLPQSEDLSSWMKISLRHSIDYVETPLTVHRRWVGQITQNKIEAADAALVVVREFISRHRQELDASDIRKGLSCRYGRRGRVLAIEKKRFAAAVELIRSLCLSPGNASALKSLIKLPLGRI